MDRYHVVTPSPLGPLTLVFAGEAISGLYMCEQRHRPDERTFGVRGSLAAAPVIRATRQLDEYFQGTRKTFDIPIYMQGTAFQLTVWNALRDIPFGAVATYGELAAHIGAPRASRAVGLANGRNPISVIVPCHRVIGANGSLTGYGGGLERKQTLLALEGALSRDGECAATRDTGLALVRWRAGRTG